MSRLWNKLLLKLVLRHPTLHSVLWKLGFELRQKLKVGDFASLLKTDTGEELGRFYFQKMRLDPIKELDPIDEIHYLVDRVLALANDKGRLEEELRAARSQLRSLRKKK